MKARRFEGQSDREQERLLLIHSLPHPGWSRLAQAASRSQKFRLVSPVWIGRVQVLEPSSTASSSASVWRWTGWNWLELAGTGSS